jgi:tetratricopeptide (TPR) repeat protein
MWCVRLLIPCTLFATLAAGAPQSVEQAQQMEARGDWKGAEAAWRALAEQSPNDYRLWTNLGIALAHQERYDDAVAAYRKALAIQPDAAQTELNLGLAYFKAGKLREALQPLHSAAAALPDNVQASILLGMSLYGTRQYRAAAPYLENVVTRSDGNAQLRSVLAQCYLRAGEYDKAKSEFEQMLKQDPDSASVHMLLGEAYDALNLRQDAIAEFRAAVAAKQPVPLAHFGLGYLLWAERSYDEAAAEFQKELASDPKNAHALAYLGDIELKKGNRTEAEQLFHQAIELQPVRIAHFDLGVMASDDRHYTVAIEQFNRAVSLDPKQPDAHYRLAHIYQELHRKGEAQEQLAIVKQLHERTHDDLLLKISGAAEPETKR